MLKKITTIVQDLTMAGWEKKDNADLVKICRAN